MKNQNETAYLVASFIAAGGEIKKCADGEKPKRDWYRAIRGRAHRRAKARAANVNTRYQSHVVQDLTLA